MISQTEIKDSEGRIATIYGVAADESSLIARLENDHLVSVPLNMLQIENSERYFLTRSFRELQELSSEKQTIPVIEEIPKIEKKKVETARIRIKKSVTESPKVIEETLAKEEFVIERVPVDQILDQPAEMRQEGEVTVLPVQEEILVVQKKYLIREEIRIRKVTTKHDEKVTVSLRKEEVTIDRKKIN